MEIKDTEPHQCPDFLGDRQPEDKVARDSDRNFWMTEEALEYHLISKIITNIDDIGWSLIVRLLYK